MEGWSWCPFQSTGQRSPQCVALFAPRLVTSRGRVYQHIVAKLQEMSFTHFICFQKSVWILKCWITLNLSPLEMRDTAFPLVCPFLFRTQDCFMNSSDNATHYWENARLSGKMRHFTRELQSGRHDTNLGTKFRQNQTTKHSQECTWKQDKLIQENVLSELLCIKLTFSLITSAIKC